MAVSLGSGNTANHFRVADTAFLTLSATTGWAIGVWARLLTQTGSTANLQYLYSFAPYGDNGSLQAIYYETDGSPTVGNVLGALHHYWKDDTGQESAAQDATTVNGNLGVDSSSNDLVLDEWRLWVIDYDPDGNGVGNGQTRIRSCLPNGTVRAEAALNNTMAGDINSNDPLCIGGRLDAGPTYNSARAWKGELARWVKFSEPLADADIEAMAASITANPSAITPAVDYILDANTDIADEQANAGNAVLYGTVTVVSDPVFNILDDYERSSVNLSGSSVTGTGDSAVIVIKPRVQESEVVSSQTRWLEPSAKVIGFNGFRPTFKFSDYAATPANGTYHGAPWQTARRPMFSYDFATWTYFDTQTVNADNIEFRHSTAFTSDTVYISRGRQTSVEQTGAWLEAMATAYPTMFGPSDAAAAFTPTLTTWSGQAFIADEFAAQTDELGATIPATPFFAAEIDDPALSPASGSKTLAVLTAGAHAGEDLGNYAMREFVEFVLGASADAQEIRKHYRILIYPVINAPGRAGGGWRGSFTQGTGGIDDANRHFSDASPGLEIVTIPRTVMVADMASAVPDWMIDWHGTYANQWSVFVDTGNALQGTFRTTLATNSGFTVADEGDTVAGFISRYYQDTIGTGLALTLEHGDPSPVTDANLATWGAAVAATLVDMQASVWTGATDYTETFSASAASGTALTDAWALDYPETLAASAASGAALTDLWELSYTETYAAAAASGADYTDSYAAGTNYVETFAATAISVATLTETYSAQYSETFAATAASDAAFTDSWALGYAETFAAAAAGSLELTDAYATPGAYDETFNASALSGLSLTAAYISPLSTPLADGPLYAARIGSFTATSIGVFRAARLN